MRIALLNGFPNLAGTAELEFIARFHIAAVSLGLETRTVVTSDDIVGYAPDLVLATHEYSRKLTGVPTIALLWSPTAFFEDDAYRVRSVRSHDGYLVGSEPIRRYLKDLGHGLGIDKPIGEGLFLPTTCIAAEHAWPRSSPPSLCYVGVHWDGERHKRLLTALAGGGGLTLYGPEASWRDYGPAYAGVLPFDGRSVPRAIAGHGIALCLHKREHRAANTPSMRIFEALSVGAIVICDAVPFAIEQLGDFAFVIDAEAAPDQVCAQVRHIVATLAGDTAAAAARAARGRAWFEANWSLELKIRQELLPLYERVVRSGAFRAPRAAAAAPGAGMSAGTARWLKRRSPAAPAPDVEIVMRAGGRSPDVVARALAAVRAANSAALSLGVILVDYVGRPDLAALCDARAAGDVPITYRRSPTTGYRSTALWDGLRAATARYVAHLDDDDSVFPNHYRQLAATLARFPDADVAYGGVVRFEEDGSFVAAPHFDGELGAVVAERRELEFLDGYDLPRLARFDNFITSNAWLARRPVLQSVLGEDPELVVSEDMYLLLLMAARGPFAFTGSATAMWHWRTRSQDNSMLNVDPAIWAQTARRVGRMLAHVPFPVTLSLAQLAQLGRPEGMAAPRATPSLPPLDTGDDLAGGLAIGRRLALADFHAPETDGVWTGAVVARMDMNPAARLRREGGVLTLRVMPAPIPDPGETWFELEVAGGARVRRSYEDPGEQEIRLPLAAGHAGVYRILVRVPRLLAGGRISADMRDLGLYVKSLRIDPAP